MLNENFIDLSVEKLTKYIRDVLEKSPDYVLVNAVVAPKSVTAPTKRKPNYVVETVNVFSPDCFVDQTAAMRGLLKSGYLFIAFMPRDIVNQEFLGKQSNGTTESDNSAAYILKTERELNELDVAIGHQAFIGSLIATIRQAWKDKNALTNLAREQAKALEDISRPKVAEYLGWQTEQEVRGNGLNEWDWFAEKANKSLSSIPDNLRAWIAEQGGDTT